MTNTQKQLHVTTTSTEENYLKAIYHLSSGHSEAVLTSEIAQSMSTTSASVTDMIKRLSDKNLIEYERYRGVRITRKGEKLALNIIRRHRLWEVFLTEILNFKWDEVHEMAEELEHVSSDELVIRLDAFLGHPRFDPHGDPIPDSNGKLANADHLQLSQCPVLSVLVVSGVNDHTADFLRFIEKKGLTPGVIFTIEETDDYDKSMLIRFGNGSSTFISQEISKNILVRHHE